MSGDVQERSRGLSLGWFFTALTIAAGALSLTMLVKQGIDLGSFAYPLQTCLDWYNTAINFALGWAEPYLAQLAVTLRDLTGLDLKLSPGWKHVLVASLTLFGGVSRMSFANGRPGVGLFALGAALLSALWFAFLPVEIPAWVLIGFVGLMLANLTLFSAIELLRGKVDSARDDLTSLGNLYAVPLGTIIFIATNAGLKLAGL